MAQELDDGEFWLPSEFLTDEELLMDFKPDYSKTTKSSLNAFGFNSDPSSPGDSVTSSTETESDEDDFISGLTRDLNLSTDYTSKGLKLSGSPQSTLCGFKSGLNPNTAPVSLPPDSEDAIGWDLLYAAAGEVARMTMAEETAPFCSNKLYAPPPPNPTPAAVKRPTPPSAYYQNQAQKAAAHIAFMQLQATHFQRMKQQQMMKTGVWGQGRIEYHHFQSGGKRNGNGNRESATTEGLSMAAWPTLQQSQQHPKPGSGARTVFIDAGAKKERTGTGVFLPRGFNTNLAENRKNSGYSAVIFPQHRRTQIPAAAVNQELSLPQEWTY